MRSCEKEGRGSAPIQTYGRYLRKVVHSACSDSGDILDSRILLQKKSPVQITTIKIPVVPTDDTLLTHSQPVDHEYLRLPDSNTEAVLVPIATYSFAVAVSAEARESTL